MADLEKSIATIGDHNIAGQNLTNVGNRTYIFHITHSEDSRTFLFSPSAKNYLDGHHLKSVSWSLLRLVLVIALDSGQ